MREINEKRYLVSNSRRTSNRSPIIKRDRDFGHNVSGVFVNHFYNTSPMQINGNSNNSVKPISEGKHNNSSSRNTLTYPDEYPDYLSIHPSIKIQDGCGDIGVSCVEIR